MSGQWIALDSQYYFSPLADRLKARFGACGLTLWPAFLCACKRSHTPGTITYSSDQEALRMMGLDGLKLVDHDGKQFDLDSFWTLTGQLKQTRRTRRGQLLNVHARHWGHWQDDSRREADAKRKAQARAAKLAAVSADTSEPVRGQSETVPDMSAPDNDLRLTTSTSPLSPPKGATPEASQRNGNGHITEAGAAADAKSAMPAKPPIVKQAKR